VVKESVEKFHKFVTDDQQMSANFIAAYVVISSGIKQIVFVSKSEVILMGMLIFQSRRCHMGSRWLTKRVGRNILVQWNLHTG